MLVTELSGARLGLASTVLVLVLLPVLTSHRSPAKHHSDTIVRLLNTPAHQLDDAAIWEVAAFLSNYTSLPSEGNRPAPVLLRRQSYPFQSPSCNGLGMSFLKLHGITSGCRHALCARGPCIRCPLNFYGAVQIRRVLRILMDV